MEELEALVRRFPFNKNGYRTNIGPSAATKYAGKRMLLEPVLSNSVHGAGRTVNQARMLELVREMLPDVGSPLMLTVNKNVTCQRHKDARNASEVSYIAFFGDDYQGGELVVEEPEGDRVLSERNVCHRFKGKEHYHYNLPHTGTKFRIVAYSQNGNARGAVESAARQDVC